MTRKMKRRLLVVVLVIGLAPAAAAQESILDRPLDPPFGWPNAGVGVKSARDVARIITSYARVPVGFEAAQDQTPTNSGGRWTLDYGATVRDVLALLPRVDPTYRWLDVGGVI